VVFLQFGYVSRHEEVIFRPAVFNMYNELRKVVFSVMTILYKIIQNLFYIFYSTVM